MNRFIPHHTEISSFLSAAQQEHAEDTSRLVLADYLEERGDPRADMIRASVQFANHHPGEDKWHNATNQLDDWKQQHLDQWLGKTAGIEKSIYRGLVHLGLQASQLGGKLLSLKIRDAINDGWVQKLALRHVDERTLQKVIDLRRVGQISELEMAGTLHQSVLAQLIESSPTIHQLHLQEIDGISDQLLDQISNFTDLHAFSISQQHQWSSEGFQRFVEKTAIRELSLVAIDPQSCDIASSLSSLSALEKVHLALTFNGSLDFLHVIKCWPKLQKFSLTSSYRWNPKFLEPLNLLKNLSELSISLMDIIPNGKIETIASLTQLRTVCLTECNFPPLDLRTFASRDSLEEIDLRWSRLMPSTIDSLQSCTKLKRLNLSWLYSPEAKIECLSNIKCLWISFHTYCSVPTSN